MNPTDCLLTGDCLRLLSELPEGSVDLAFADPPFNIGYEYDVYDDRQTKEKYLAWTDQWLTAGEGFSCRSPNGRRGRTIGRQRCFPFSST
jgi:DNA modification methylase